MSSPSRRTRLLVIPLLLFVGVSGTVFVLAKLHPARPSVPQAAAGGVQLGDQYRGETVFQQSCSSCHGDGGKGGGVGPALAGSGLTVAAVHAKIASGGSIMPAGLVSGRQEADLLAYLQTILSG